MTIEKNLRNKQGVYVLHINRHIYVGSSCNLGQRLHSHLCLIKQNKHENLYLQRAVNKYGIDKLWYEIAEFCPNLSIDQLRERELHYIQYYDANLNLKKDPTTERNCTTISIQVFQYSLNGDFIKSWPSASEAARNLNVSPSNIQCCCTKPYRQRCCKNFLWSYQYPYPFSLPKPIYVFDLLGNLVGAYNSTVDIAKSLFSNISQKTVLSQLKKKIDCGVPYKEYYFSYIETYCIPPSNLVKYKPKLSIDKILASNPIIYIYDKQNNLSGSSFLEELPHESTIKSRIKQGRCYKYSLELRQLDNYVSPTKKHKCKVQHVETGEIFIFNNRVAAAIALFGDKRYHNHIGKHLQRNTPFRNYRFWDL